MIRLSPVVYTPTPLVVVDACEKAGLSTVTRGDRGRWFEMRGRSASLAVHQSRELTPRVELAFATDDAESSLSRLQDAGYADAHIWDEAFGRVVGVHAPEGGRLWITVDQDDFYGYEHAGYHHGTGSITATLTTRYPNQWALLLDACGIPHRTGGDTELNADGHITIRPGSTGIICHVTDPSNDSPIHFS